MQKDPPLSQRYGTKRGIRTLWIIFFAKHGQGAFVAAGALGGAAIPAEQDDPVAEIGAFLRRKNGAQLLFHLLRLLALAQPKPTADTDTVGVADNAAGNSIQVT